MSAVTGKCSQVQASWEQHGGRGFNEVNADAEQLQV